MYLIWAMTKCCCELCLTTYKQDPIHAITVAADIPLFNGARLSVQPKMLGTWLWNPGGYEEFGAA